MLGVSDRGYHKWLNGPASARAVRHQLLGEAIGNIHAASKGCYGIRRIQAELRFGLGICAGREQIHLVMKTLGIRGLSGTRRRYVNKAKLITAADLVDRNFTVTEPDKLWCTDITEHPTREGKVYCCAVIDAFSRKIVGWAIDSRQTTNLVLNALDMAIMNRKPRATTLHSDHGTQFTSWAFTTRLTQAGLVGSMGTIGDGYDNAMIESFWGKMQVELLDRQKWCTRTELANAMFEYIEIYHNRSRRHSKLGYLSPVEFEAQHKQLQPAS